MQYEFTGIVKVIKPVQEFTATFKKRELVVTSEDERFPQNVVFEVVNDKTILLDAIQPGERVTVTFDIRGNESKTQPGRYFNSLRVWKLAKADGAGAGAAVAAGASNDAPPPVPVAPVDVDMGDLPF